jgi:8-oxo-dGTP diphosphatase
METLAKIDLEGGDSTSKDFSIRNAARLVIVNADNKVALMYSELEDFYKLPGGGLEKDENPEEAAKREGLEETGYEVTINRALGKVQEIRREQRLIQNSFSYLAVPTGIPRKPNLTMEEKERKFVVTWKDFDEANEKICDLRNESLAARYVSARDSAILNAARVAYERGV